MNVPIHLSNEAKKLWKILIVSFELEESSYILLKVMLEAYDRLQQARKEIKKYGLVIKNKDTGQLHENPALKIEKDARSGFLQSWRRLSAKVIRKNLGRPTDERILKWQNRLNVVSMQ